MHRSIAWVSAALLGVLLSGCGSLEKDAREKLENGEYEAAMGMYEKILSRDANDADAQEGLKRARGGVLADRLIDVRRARDSGRADQALEILLEVNTREKQWNVYPPAAARFTQEEETGFAWKPFRARIDSLLSGKLPLAADWTWIRYSPVFAGSKHAQDLEALRPSIQRAGRETCATWSRETSREVPFYGDFVSKYCRYWKTSAKVAPNGRARAAQLVSGLDFKAAGDGIPGDLVAIFRKDFEDALKSSAWYDPEGARRISVAFSGTYHFTHVKNLVTRVKQYEVSEPYTEMESVTKTRLVPRTVTSTQTDANGVSHPVTTVENVSESYTESVPVTHYRSVSRQFPYSALFHQQTIDISESVSAKIGDQGFTLADSNRAVAEGDEQSITNEEAGLRPMQPALLNPPAWVGGESAKLKSQFAKKLTEEWLAQACANPGKTSEAKLADRIMKCRRDPAGAASGFVNDWYAKTFGIAQADAEALLVTAGATAQK
jgi:hypothetical protein